MTNKFYVYEHWRPDKDICFYVGKGKGRRANVMYGRGSHHERIQAKLKRLGMCGIHVYCKECRRIERASVL